MLQVKQMTPYDDLESISLAINNASWDDQNDMSIYTKDGLDTYLKNNDAIFLVCFIDDQLAGIASGIVLQKPYGQETWLYIDEVDVAVPHRRNGVGKALMQEFFNISKEKNCVEVWVGSETKNTNAHKFYNSFHPTDIEEFIGYTFKKA